MGISILAISFIVLLIMGMPVAFALGISSMLSVIITEVVPVNYLTQTMFGAVDSYSLLAVPLFVLSGVIMEYGGLSKRLIDAAKAFVGHITGGLPAVTLLGTTVFAMLSGSGPATVAAIGGIMIPAMIREGYGRGFSAGILATSGGVGIVIPPSIPLIIYGITTNTSIGDLFLAGLIPGIVIVLTLYIVSRYICKKKGYGIKSPKANWGERRKAIWRAKWTLMMPLVVLGGIYGGVFTPTEASGIAVAYSLVLAILYREAQISQIPLMLKTTFLISGMILVIIATASTYARILTLERIPTLIASFLGALPVPFWIVLAVIVLLLLFVGMFMETIAGIILLAPILVPVVMQMGMDPVHFGIVMIMASMIGFATPPVGDNLNVASAISGLSIEKVSIAALPFVAALVAILFLVAYVPQISLFLPNLLG
ncbi:MULTISPECIES: TRAP transporter large permease [Halomonadaceae]|uniref:TRAP transporter large permease protein n=1 Tax=Vreelandella neptunia TaxID=115551 RepID=A0ABZ0YJV0_9GAMM|nr:MULTISPECIES: TRAP transporter large permease [Halomonas]MDN3562648.1 TRAP transporter large permease [Halomonas neptunia]UEQ03871.1 TRAP transporter large permease [Halomonas profundus]WQH12389.1 TRAP transporter large permease [Halomonas neptunia]CDG51659.1 C4-dicarboxylate transport system (Permease large protein) [Halomonas sp. A3H3]|tara:strand:- start:2401 stop:3678 length:1278 start_codon:yes stop_codon:yes gene_type:complete